MDRIVRLRVAAALACVIALATAGCSQPGVQTASTRPAAQAENAPQADDATDRGSQTSDLSTSATDVSANSNDAADATDPVDAEVEGPAAIDIPYETPIKVSSSVSPGCVSLGDTVTITVTAPKGAVVAFQAVYSDSQGGAEPPYGAGYGGNDHGKTNKRKIYRGTWVIKPNAPAGPARVDVVVGYKGEYGYDDPHFAVADINGACPESWLDKDRN